MVGAWVHGRSMSRRWGSSSPSFYRSEVVTRGGAAHELERFPELADVGRLHAEDRRLLAHEERGLHRRQWPAELADDGVAPAGSQEVEALRERVRSARQLELLVGPAPA